MDNEMKPITDKETAQKLLDTVYNIQSEDKDRELAYLRLSALFSVLLE